MAAKPKKRVSKPSIAMPIKITTPAAERLGGWLLLVGVQLVATPLLLGLSLYTAYKSFTLTWWLGITTQGSASFIPYYSVYFMGTIAFYAVLLISYLFMLVLFFRKKRAFPRVYFMAFLLLVANGLFTTLAELCILPAEMVDYTTTNRLMILTIIAAFLAAYMRSSARVSHTFVRP